MQSIILGNIFSLFAMGFLFIALSHKDNHKLVFFQAFAHFFFILSALVVKGYSGAVQDIIGLIRNLLILKGLNSQRIRKLLLVSAVVLGIIFNNMGLVGLLPVIATLQYTLISTKKDISNNMLQISLILNAILLTGYSLALHNYVNVIANFISIGISLSTIYRNFKDQKH